MQALVPVLRDQLLKLLQIWHLAEGIEDIVDRLVEVQLPVLVFVLNAPLDDALVLDRCGQHHFVLRYLHVINHRCMRLVVSGGSHFAFPHEFKVEIFNSQLLDRQR